MLDAEHPSTPSTLSQQRSRSLRMTENKLGHYRTLTFMPFLSRFLYLVCNLGSESVVGKNGMMQEYVPIGIMVLLGVAAGIVFTNINRLIGPKHPSEEKLSTYESGMEPVKSARERFSVKFYLVAMLFIVFDIEIVFMYPWAVMFRQLGLFGFIEMMVFIFILLVGFLYILKKGALQWH